jgi:glucan biosynthesis protein C
MTRHYGMDWLRIGAFALLIVYHIGMVFVPWNFHVKSLHVEDWMRLPMLASNAWRLTLLFVVSGYASRALLDRSSGVGTFFGNRCYRLLVPLLFGMAVIVPPQPWVELVTKHGYTASYWTFWTHDNFRFGPLAGLSLPTWNHLWFVIYLWIYTSVLTLGLVLNRGTWLQTAFDRIFGSWLVLALPVAWLVFIHGWWFQMAAETHALLGDWVAHVMYFPAFLFGFGLARSEVAMAAITRWWKISAVAARLCRDHCCRAAMAGRHRRAALDLSRIRLRACARAMGRDHRVDRHRRAVLEPRSSLATRADRGGVPLLPDPSDDHRSGDVRAASRRAPRLG